MAKLLFLSLLWVAALRQEKPPVPPVPGSKAAEAADPAIIALTPGAIPADATPAAREAWERVKSASFAPGVERAPIGAFELELEVRYRRNTGPGGGDLKAVVYRFLAPGFVRIDVGEKAERSTLRGPVGDWVLDRPRDQRINVTTGREYAEDRRQLDETLSIARNFVSLSDPRSLRLASLELLPSAPADLPEPLQKRARELSWLRLRSPDFRLVGPPAAARIHRATLGFDKKSGRVEQSLVEEEVADTRLRPSARVVGFRGTSEVQGYLVPKFILVYSVEEGASPLRFAPDPAIDMWVKRADLRPPLKAEDFKP